MKRIMVILAGLIFPGLSAASAAADHAFDDVGRIVAFGDIHGDYEQFTSLLLKAGLLDKRGNWAGGRTHFVQLGDVTDRGPDSRKIVDLIMRLERQAKRARGQVHFVIGNHEAMNMVGDLRYVHPGEYEAFRTSSSERELDRVYRVVVDQIKTTKPEEEWPDFEGAFREEWYAAHPPGFVELRRAWGPKGKYGRWLLKHHAVIRINNILFVHGGISPAHVDASPEELNEAVAASLETGVYDATSIIVDENGPLWYRGLAVNDEGIEAPHVAALLANHNVSHMVVAHTPLVGAIFPRFGDDVVLIDVGLGAYYGSREAWLEAESGALTAVHRGTRLALPSEGGQARIDYLKAAAALDPEPSVLLTTIRRLEAGRPPASIGISE